MKAMYAKKQQQKKNDKKMKEAWKKSTIKIITKKRYYD